MLLATDQAHKVDRNGHRALRVIHTGWDFVERRLALDDPIDL